MIRCKYCGVPTTIRLMEQPVCVVCADLLAKGRPPRPWVQTDSQSDISKIVTADLDLGFNLVETAKGEGDAAAAMQRIERAKEALESVRYFTASVRDPQAFRFVKARTKELAADIEEVERNLADKNRPVRP